jgi:Zn-dependent M28 family amino/carboxypeptidase
MLLPVGECVLLYPSIYRRLPNRLPGSFPASLVALIGGLLSVNGFIAEAAVADEGPSLAAQAVAERVTEEAIKGHIRFLADDLLEGRGPGSRGDELTQLYLSTQMQSYGIQPAAEGNNWIQPVPLRGLTTRAPKEIAFHKADQKLTLKHFEDMMASSGLAQESVSIKDAELVFVGYGIQAPEFDWDDFKDVDVTGKILVVMNNDPEDDPALFAGKRRLYYGRWDYKYAKAAEMGAAGALIIHTTASAGYPYKVVQTSWSGEQSELAASSGPRTKLKGWLTEDASQRVMELAGYSLADLQAQAQSRDFRPVPLGVTMSIELTCAVREQLTGNVLGMLPGTDPELQQEYVVFMAHHDHLGLAAERDATGDNIYNGAIDNASGTATLLTIARALAEHPTGTKRSILFAFVGAEEQGLLGSKHLAAYPPVPAGYMAAVINIDGINFLGKTHDLNLIGNGKSNLDGLVERVAKWQGRTVVPDYSPDAGYYYRSDQFSLAQIGVPGVYLHSGINVIGKPDGWGKAQLDAWIQEKYHQPSDEYDPDWDLAGGVDDARLLLLVGWLVAEQPQMPAWNPGDEFEAARLKALEARQR